MDNYFGGLKHSFQDKFSQSNAGIRLKWHTSVASVNTPCHRSYVYVTFSDPNDYKPGAEKPQNPFGMNMMAFTSPEDLMKNLPKAIGNMSKAMTGGGFPTDSPTFKISMRENEVNKSWR
jgi:hypothetical protein